MKDSRGHSPVRSDSHWGLTVAGTVVAATEARWRRAVDLVSSIANRSRSEPAESRQCESSRRRTRPVQANGRHCCQRACW